MYESFAPERDRELAIEAQADEQSQSDGEREAVRATGD
jgi:hypothetical protein